MQNDLLNQIWAIRPDRLDAMIQGRPELNEKLVSMVANFTPDPVDSHDFLLRDGVGIIPVTGPIMKRGSFWSMFYGGTPLSVLQTVFSDAMDDDDVQAIVLDIDSPGGTVSGTEAFSQLVADARGIKPVVSFANGMMASAAYWIGSAADKIVAEKTADIGSIGVVMVHNDWSEEDKKMGLVRTILTAGKYKALGNDAEPLSDLARKTFQDQLDYIYTLFVDTVAVNRRTDAATVLKDMADGRIFIGQQAMDAGLVDEIGTLEIAIEAAQDMVSSDSQETFSFKSFKQEVNTMKTNEIKTAEQLATAFPELTQALIQQGADGVNLDDARTQAASDEKNRILALASIQFGKEAGEKFSAVVETGVTVEQFRAINGAASPAANTDKDNDKDKILAALQNTGAENPGADSNTQVPADFMVLVDQYAADHKCSKRVAMQAVARDNKKAHEAYLKNCN